MNQTALGLGSWFFPPWEDGLFGWCGFDGLRTIWTVPLFHVIGPDYHWVFLGGLG